MPAWVNTAFAEYQKRLPKTYQLELVEIAAIKRFRDEDTDKILEQEANKIRKSLKSNDIVVALDRLGNALSTMDLAQQIQQWFDLNANVAIIIGGAEGIAPSLINQADYTWSLSALTYPHPLVRVIIAEQIYRAFAINTNHPYHR